MRIVYKVYQINEYTYLSPTKDFLQWKFSGSEIEEITTITNTSDIDFVVKKQRKRMTFLLKNYIQKTYLLMNI